MTFDRAQLRIWTPAVTRCLTDAPLVSIIQDGDEGCLFLQTPAQRGHAGESFCLGKQLRAPQVSGLAASAFAVLSEKTP